MLIKVFVCLLEENGRHPLVWGKRRLQRERMRTRDGEQRHSSKPRAKNTDLSLNPLHLGAHHSPHACCCQCHLNPQPPFLTAPVQFHRWHPPSSAPLPTPEPTPAKDSSFHHGSDGSNAPLPTCQVPDTTSPREWKAC